MATVLIAGCGWLGCDVACALIARGDRVIGLRRSAAAAAALEAVGIEPLVADLTDPGVGSRLPRDVDAVIACPAPGRGGVEAYERTYVVGLGRLLERYAGRAAAGFVYTGSTGVFGQTDGGEVDERTPVLPTTANARVLAEAERRVLCAAADGGPAARIVRLSGLYGPGRYGIVDRVRDGRLSLGPGDGAWMNFCHRTDATRMVLATLDRGSRGAIYHASDAAPSRRREVIRWIARRWGFTPHRAATPTAGPGRADRRVRADASRGLLGVELAYPSFREGLTEALGDPP